MDKDKAIRSAKLTAAGILDKARARTAVTRAGGQIAPSKYLPNVPRAVHAGGGKVEGDNGHIYVVHGGSDFDQINPSYSGRGEPGDIRPLGKGLYGYVIDHADPENFKNAIGWATRYSQKYGGGKKALHVFKIPKSSSTVFNGDREIDPKLYPNAEGYPKPIKGLADEPTAELNAYEAHRANRPPNADPAWWDWSNKSTALKNALKNAADLRMEHLPIGLTEVAIQNPKVATRIGKFSLDTPTSDILDAVKDDAQARADGGSVTDSDEFRNWFGNSATHTDGDPHVFYHGTSKDKDFTSFNVGRHGAWFTRDPAEASEYAERNDSQGYKHEAGWKLTPTNTASRVIPAYVKAENPYTGDLPDEVLRSNYKAAQSDWFDTLRRKGHDAWIPARHNGDLVVALKEPQQIKSIFNNGKFDPNQKHMNKSGGGSATGSLREKALWPSAQAIKAGTGSREAHAEMVNKIKPVSPYAAPVPPASDEQVHDALTKDKQPKAFAPRGLGGGTPVAVRLDIPAYEKKNTWVVSVHHPKTDFTAGEVIGYDSVAHIGNPRFGVHPTGALNIASGKPKSTIATVHGNWKKTTPEDAFALSQTIHNDPQWRQVGMDPERHSYFYDRETQEPVMAADEALHIGPLVYAKNPVYGKKTDFAFSSGGDVEGDNGITAYHSSPHDFDQFDVSKLGTGEGNQSYGPGLYFAENPKVSDRGGQYWNQFMNMGKQTPEKQAAFALKVAGWDRDKAAEGLQKNFEYHADRAIPGKYAEGPELEEGNRLLAQETQEAIDHVRSGKILGPRTYKVKINAKPHELIDWDEPMSEQHPNIQAVLGSSHETAGSKLSRVNRNPNYRGDILGKDTATLQELYDHFRSKGIKGIRYNDAGSRHGPNGDGTKNYVMFHHDPVQIVDKYEYGGTVGKAGGGEVDVVEGNNQNGVTGNENETAPLNLAPRAQAGGLPDAGGIRGGIGVLQAQNEASLEGLPTKVSIPLTGGSVSAGHDPRIRQIARDYMASTGLPYNPPTKYAKVDPKRASRIAAAYDEMKDNASDPLTKASYDAMIKETMAQYHAAKNAGFKAEFWNPDTEEDPYKASPRLATEDVRNNHHMWVYPTRSGYGSDGPITAKELEENPLLQDSGETWNGQPATVNDIFRAVHDYYGHAKEGVGFRGDGEENAWRSHASMYSPLARMAMTSETRGQNSWLNYGVHGEKNRNARTEDTVFAPQKVGILPHWAHHEGAEDFMGPEEVNAMAAIRKVHGRASGGSVDAALALTRRFTKDGKAATLALKSKGK